MRFLADEHVPRVFTTTLQSNGHDVLRANDEFGEGTEDDHLLEFCSDEGRVLITNDKKDFAGPLSDAVDHCGIVVYTDPNVLRDDPERAVRAVERILSHYPPSEVANELVWLDQWLL
jgi:predicted nuclease of predicted toxin-antitoxin system